MSPTTISPVKIVVVDDSAVILEAGKQALEEAGFEVLTLDNPLALAHVVLRKRPDVVLLDVNMPTVSGDAVAKILAQHVPNSKVPILLHSDLPPEELSRRAAQCGAAGFVRKTSDPEELVRQVRAFLRGRGKG